MSESVDVFFYGLFMEPDALVAQGFNPRKPRKASVMGMALQIGRRATLVPRENAVAHGLLMTLERDELDQLYSDPSVAAYRPEVVTCECADGSVTQALCYNLEQPDNEPPNAQYVARLCAVAELMGLPEENIETMI